MKKLFTLLTFFALIYIDAQIFTENFDNGVPGSFTEVTVQGNLSWGPCGADTGGITCPLNGSGSATFYSPSLTGFNTALQTPVLNLSSGIFSVNFTVAKKMKNERVNEFYVEISTDGGENWNIMRSYLDEIAEPTQYSIIMTPFSPNENTLVRFRAKNRGGHRLILDDVTITQVTADDVLLESVDIPAFFSAGPTEIKGVIRNNGINPLTSFDLNWQVNGGTTQTQTYTSQNIVSGQELNFVHADLWEATGGNHAVKVWVSNTNVTDANPSNDEITKNVTVASGVTYKVPLYEKFSSSTCPPCYGFNTVAFTPFWNNYGIDRSILISYQVNWPGAGDPYYTSEVGTRVGYYGVNAAPTLLLNTTEGTLGNPTALQQRLDDVINSDNAAYFEIEADHSITGNNIDITVDILPYLAGNYTVQVMVLEKLTTQNVATNGETSFKHVFMKALPNANGTNIDFDFDQVESLNFSLDLSTTNVEEIEDVAVVVFIQNNATKEIMQSAYTAASNFVLGIEDAATQSDIVLVPNPTSGIIKVISKDEVQLQVFDLSGKNVFTQANLASNSTLNLSNLGKGIFIVHMTQKDGSKIIKKLIIK